MGYAKKINGYTPSDEIPVETGDDYKAVIRKDGDAYVIKVNGIGYIGSSGDKKMIFLRVKLPVTRTSDGLSHLMEAMLISSR